MDIVRQQLLEMAALNTAGKSAVQRDACAAIVSAYRGSSGESGGGEGSSGGGATSGVPHSEAASTRVTAVLPSGAGKTVLALRVAEALQAQLTLVLVPSLDLVSQSYRDWDRWRAAPGHLDGWAPLAVCSSASVPKAELPRTTDAADVAAFLRAGGDGPRVLFCTYHSAERVSDALVRTGCSLDLLVCDEAHRCTGRASKRDAQPLSDRFLPASRRLFLTATPRLIGASRDADGALVAAGSMDDERAFGRTVFRLGYADAIARGVVAPLKLVFVDASDSDARHMAINCLPSCAATDVDGVLSAQRPEHRVRLSALIDVPVAMARASERCWLNGWAGHNNHKMMLPTTCAAPRTARPRPNRSATS